MALQIPAFARWPRLPAMGRPDYGAAALVAGAVLLALLAGLITAYLPWLFTLILVLLPLVLLASISRPMVGLVVVVMLIFEAIPSAFQPRLPFGGGRLQAYDVLLAYLALLVMVRAWWSGGQPLRAMGAVRWPLYYLAICMALSMAYVRLYAPNPSLLSESRAAIAWLLIPIVVHSADTPRRYLLFLRAVVLMGLVLALFVTLQSLFELRIMTAARVEALDNTVNSDIVRSIAGGGVYLIVFALFLVINRVVERRWSLWWCLPAALLLVAGLAVQFGRGVWVASFIGLMLSALLLRGVSGLVKVGLFSTLTVALALGAAAVYKPRLAEALIERAVGIGTEVKYGGSFNWRRLENDLAISMIERKPLTGTGLGGQYKQTVSSQGHFGIETTYIHNGYLYFPLKMGLLATFVPLAFIAAFVLTMRQGVRRHGAQADRGFVAALAGAFAVPVITSVTQPEWADPRGIAALAVLLGLALLFRRHGDSAAAARGAGGKRAARP